MQDNRVATSLMALGLLLVACSFLLPILLPEGKMEGSWTKEQAQEHAKASANLHRLAHEQIHAQESPAEHQHHAGDHPKYSADLKREFEEAKTKYERGDAKLKQAQSLPGWIGFWLGCTGSVLLVAGVGFYFYFGRRIA
jgi:hypothetical protein